jgi:hypothetical protein
MATGKTVTVKSNLPRVDTIGYGYSKTAQGHGMSVQSFRLLPGINQIPEAQWSEAKKLPAVKDHLKKKNFEEIGATKMPGLRGYTVEAAVELVEETLDRDLLRQWKGDETREPVIAAIEVQIGKTAPGADDTTKNLEDAPQFDARPASQGFSAAEMAANLQPNNEPTAEEIAAAEAQTAAAAPLVEKAIADSKPTPAERPAAAKPANKPKNK